MTDDSPEAIRMCLSCPWPECINCLGANNLYGWAVRFDLKHSEFYRQQEAKTVDRGHAGDEGILSPLSI